jgi:hypothetical protein
MNSLLNNAALGSVAARNQDMPAANYKATLLKTNAQAIPLALLSDAEFEKVGSAENDIVVPDMNVTVRYVVDRMATAPGVCDPSTCPMVDQASRSNASSQLINSQNNGGGINPNPGAAPQQPIYRISVRVSGPRKTQSFFQSTFTTD